jgi:NAD(P)-dependent dehydrogenase (short-subunit alcohol dehydrogenase family)
MIDLSGKTALVTGGSRGIGRAIALRLATQGADVAFTFKGNAEAAAETVAAIEALGRRGLSVQGDASQPETAEAVVKTVLEAFERIDILVNNAGLYASLAMRPFDQIPVAEWRQVMDVNVLSMFLTCRAVVPIMREQGGGRIVNISSGTPFRGVPFLLHYVTSKGAIVTLTRALARELGGDDILVNCVAPGFTMSDGVQEHPEVIEALRDVSIGARTLKRDMVPGDIVGAVAFLCGPGATFITGQTMVIDGGQYFH